MRLIHVVPTICVSQIICSGVHSVPIMLYSFKFASILFVLVEKLSTKNFLPEVGHSGLSCPLELNHCTELRSDVQTLVNFSQGLILFLLTTI